MALRDALEQLGLARITREMPDVFSNEGQESTKNCSEMPIRESTQIYSPHFPRKEPHFDHFEMAMDEKNKAISENYWDIHWSWYELLELLCCVVSSTFSRCWMMKDFHEPRSWRNSLHVCRIPVRG